MANYLYNGIELPALPEWDKEKYPFAVISKTYYEGTYNLSFESVKPIVKIEASTGELWYASEGGSGVKYSVHFNYGETEWGNVLTHSGYSSHRLEHLIWANHDVLNMDGTVYLAASDPIPILAPTIEPLSMWLGWKAGNWVARQRGKA